MAKVCAEPRPSSRRRTGLQAFRVWAPKRSSQEALNLPPLASALKTLSAFCSSETTIESEKLRSGLALAPTVRSDQDCFANTKPGMHHFVFHSRLRHARFGASLKRLNISTSARQRCGRIPAPFATTLKNKMIDDIFELVIRVACFVWLNVNLPGLMRSLMVRVLLIFTGRDSSYGSSPLERRLFQLESLNWRATRGLRVDDGESHSIATVSPIAMKHCR